MKGDVFKLEETKSLIQYSKSTQGVPKVLQQILLKYYTYTSGSNSRHFVLLENSKDHFNYFTFQLPVFPNIFAKVDHKCLCV